MALPIIPIAMALANVVPGIVGMLKGPKAEQAAESVVGVAKALTGQGDPQGAVDAIIADPKLQAEFKSKLLDHQLAMRQEDNKQLEIVNHTMRSELASKDTYNGRWRATFGYCVAYSWLMLFFGIVFSMVWVICSSPDKMAIVGKAIAEILGAMVILWGVALPILGVSIKKRSDDKQTAAGVPGTGIFETLMKRGQNGTQGS